MAILKRSFWRACFVCWLSALGLISEQQFSPATLIAGDDARQASESTDGKEGDSAEQNLGKPDANPFLVAGKVVDASGDPVAGATVHVAMRHAKLDATTTTNDVGSFQFPLRMDANHAHALKISARSSDGSLVGFYRVPYSREQVKLEAIEIRIEATKTVRINVVDGEGEPIRDANVALLLNYPFTLGAAMTDASGYASLEMPASEAIHSVVAWKDHEGLDYKIYALPRDQQSDKLTQKPEFPVDSEETLRLDGAAPLAVHFTDTKGEPIARSQAYVWLLQKNANDESLNLSLLYDFFVTDSDASGVVTFDWFPSWQRGTTTIWPSAEGFVSLRGEYSPTTKAGKLNLQLDRLVPIRGRVQFPDGTPAADIAITAAGAGYTHDPFYSVVRTDDSGRYEVLASPNQIYMLCIANQKWSAPSQSGFAVLPDQEVEEHDFILSEATRVFGKVTNKVTGEPVEGTHVSLRQTGVALNAMGEDVLPNPEKSNRWVCPMQQVHATSGRSGEFEFLVGNGDYRLFASNSEGLDLSIQGEKEREIDVPIEVQVRSLLTGKVVDVRDGQPVEGARVRAVSRNLNQSLINDWQASTNSEGKFQVERFAEASYLHGTNADETLGTIFEIEADDTVVLLELNELGSASGRLMTEDGLEPAADVMLTYGVRIHDKKSGLSSDRFGKGVTTGSQGEFTLSNLVPGWQYECTLSDHPGGFVLTVAKATVQAGETLELGELKMPMPPKPYVPPTLEEQIQNAFDVRGRPLKRYEQAKRLVQTVNQNLLIVFAEPTDPRVHTLMQIRFEDQDFRPYRDDFRFMAIPTDGERIESAQALAEALDLAALQEEGEFLLVILDREGDVVAKIDSQKICEGSNLSKDLLFNELEQHKTTPLDGKKLLEEALAKAQLENKRVIVQETATWCGPCHMLSRFLLENRQWEKDYVWVKMDHRWTGAIEIMKELRADADGGIPWVAILDASGQKLATSNLLDSGTNIGFPHDDESRQHFVHMLQSTRQRMTDQEIEELAAATLNQK